MPRGNGALGCSDMAQPTGAPGVKFTAMSRDRVAVVVLQQHASGDQADTRVSLECFIEMLIEAGRTKFHLY